MVMALIVGVQPAAAQEAPGNAGVTVHVVQYGESLFDIADLYHAAAYPDQWCSAS